MSTYYIATTGNDTTGNGSSGTPWLTISKAHTSAAAGDTVILKSGTYTIANQTFSKDITWQAESTLLTILTGASGNVVWTFTASSTFVGFRVTAITPTTAWLTLGGSLTATIAFTRCQFDTFVLPTTGNDLGFFRDHSGANISNMTLVFTSCLWYGFTRSSTSNESYLFVTRSANMLIRLTNCVFYNSAASTARVSLCYRQNTTGTVITFVNSIWHNAAAAMTLGTTTVTGTITYTNADQNCFYNWNSLPAGLDNITSDPLFVDAPNANFNLRPTSPCISTGTLV